MSSTVTNERGRPRGFDPDVALDAALRIFWRKGFDAASLSDLTDAMQLNKPSLYAAFGDKETLYLRALERYGTQRMAPHFAQLHVARALDQSIQLFLQSLVEMFTHPQLPGGCFVINGTADMGMSNVPMAIETALTQSIAYTEKQLLMRLQAAQRNGELAARKSIGKLVDYLMSLIAGLAVLARIGTPRKRLLDIVKLSMQNWAALSRD